jgi:hypothetical protein
MTLQEIAKVALLSVQQESVATDTMVIVVAVRATSEYIETETVSNVTSRRAMVAGLSQALDNALEASIAAEVEVITRGNA